MMRFEAALQFMEERAALANSVGISAWNQPLELSKRRFYPSRIQLDLAVLNSDPHPT